MTSIYTSKIFGTTGGASGSTAIAATTGYSLWQISGYINNFNPNPFITGVTDTSGNTYASRTTAQGQNIIIDLWTSENISGGSPLTTTVAFSQAGVNLITAGLSIAGAANPSYDTGGASGGIVGFPTTTFSFPAAFTPLHAHELVIYTGIARCTAQGGTPAITWNDPPGFSKVLRQDQVNVANVLLSVIVWAIPDQSSVFNWNLTGSLQNVNTADITSQVSGIIPGHGATPGLPIWGVGQ